MTDYQPMTPKLAASQVREAAKGYKLAFKDFENQKVIVTDAGDLRHIASLIRQEKLSEARQAVLNLDTLVREYVPSDVYLWLGCGG